METVPDVGVTETISESLQTDIESLESRLQDALGVNSVARESIELLRQTLSTCGRKAQRMKELIENQRYSLAAVKTQIASLQSTLESEETRYSEGYAEFRADNEWIAMNLAEQATLQTTSEEALSMIGAEIQEYRQRERNAVSQKLEVAALAAEVRRMESEASSTESTIQDVGQTTVKNRQMIKKLDASNSFMEKQMADIEAELSAEFGEFHISQVFPKAVMEKAELEEEAESAQEELRAAEKASQGAEAGAIALYAELAALKESLGGEGAQSEEANSVEELVALRVELESSFGPLEAEIEAERGKVEGLVLSLSDESVKKAKLDSEMQEVEEDGETVDELMSSVAALREEEAQLQADLSALVEGQASAEGGELSARSKLLIASRELDIARSKVSEYTRRTAELDIQKQFLTQAVTEESSRNTRIVATIVAFGDIDKRGEQLWLEEKKTLQTAPPYISALTLLEESLRDPRALGDLERMRTGVNVAIVKSYLETAAQAERKKDWATAVAALEKASLVDGDDQKVLSRRFSAMDKMGLKLEGHFDENRTGFGQLWHEIQPKRSGGLFSRKKTTTPAERKLLYTGTFYRGLRNGVGREFNPSTKSLSFYGLFHMGQRQGQGVEYAKGRKIILIGEWYHGRLVKNLSLEEPNQCDMTHRAETFAELIGREEDEEQELNGVRILSRVDDAISSSLDVFHLDYEFEEEADQRCFRFFGTPKRGRAEAAFREKLYKRLRLLCFATHPNVMNVRSFSIGSPRGLLTEVLKQPMHPLILNPRFADWGLKVDLILKTAEGMEYLHSLGLFHAQLSWHCVYFIESEDLRGGWSVKIGDYGLRPVLKHFRTLPNTMYTAPEVWSNGADLASDVFSFGIMMYEILSATHDTFDTATRPNDPRLFPENLPASVRGGLRPSLLQIRLPPNRVWWSNLMQKCWADQHTLRPTFSTIVETIRMSEADVNMV